MEKLRILTVRRIQEGVLLALIALIAVTANVPVEYVEQVVPVDRGVLLGVLTLSVVIGFFFYLRFFAFLAEVLLIAGANLPEQIAEGFGIAKLPLLLALVAIVGVSLINYVVKILPTGLEPSPKKKSAEVIGAMMKAIESNNVLDVRHLLLMSYDPNVLHEDGNTPLAAAARRGNLKMVQALLRYGADPRMTSKEGDTPIELALRSGHATVADLLRQARQTFDASESARQ